MPKLSIQETAYLKRQFPACKPTLLENPTAIRLVMGYEMGHRIDRTKLPKTLVKLSYQGATIALLDENFNVIWRQK